MNQRVQSILFFLSAICFGLLFFMPMAAYVSDDGTYYKLFAYGINTVSEAPGFSVPFGMLYTLPLLLLTVAVTLLNFYLSVSIVKAVKLQKFVSLLKISRWTLALAVVMIAAVFVFYLMKTGAPISVAPSFRWPAWGAFLLLVALIMMVLASAGLKKDIDKVRSMDRIR